ncbi:hypothetical protein PHET_12350 [Paragonimus heterotremus]|uniref:Uncharacterized protein n=1 Tax=Paragonimus heterotremus TaxID=100268 RepID=A0A8J4WD19_9TREM|nr:hypothetical protein PHET_12350 [Paragonimus heterotremus]
MLIFLMERLKIWTRNANSLRKKSGKQVVFTCLSVASDPMAISLSMNQVRVLFRERV